MSSTSNVSNISSNTQMSGMSASSGNNRVYYVKKEAWICIMFYMGIICIYVFVDDGEWMGGMWVDK